jgi:hypothetical protein
LQALCGGKATDSKIVPPAARAEGISAADDAAQQLKALGMFRGGAIYYDMENYPTTELACRSAVLTFLSAWTRELHRLGYVSGVYENLNLGARDLGVAGRRACVAFCQKAGSKVGSTSIWDEIDSQHWVSDNWVATPSTTGYSKPAPRC